MAGPFMSRMWLAAVLLPLSACDQSLTPRAEGLPLAPGEEREAAPAWRLREGLVASTVVESGEPLTRNIGEDAPRLPSRIDSISFWGEPGHGLLWIEHGKSASSLRVERDAAQEWALTLTSSNTTYDVASPHLPEEVELERAQSPRLASTTLGRPERDVRAPMVSDGDGALWFASGGELFYLDAATEGAKPERLAAAPGDGIIVSMAWNTDESSLFLGLQDGADRASVVALSAR